MPTAGTREGKEAGARWPGTEIACSAGQAGQAGQEGRQDRQRRTHNTAPGTRDPEGAATRAPSARKRVTHRSTAEREDSRWTARPCDQRSSQSAAEAHRKRGARIDPATATPLSFRACVMHRTADARPCTEVTRVHTGYRPAGRQRWNRSRLARDAQSVFGGIEVWTCLEGLNTEAGGPYLLRGMSRRLRSRQAGH